MVVTPNTPDGKPTPKQMQLIQDTWKQEGMKHGIEVSAIDHTAPLSTRISQAVRAGLDPCVIYSRFSTKKQNSTDDQLRACLQLAASKNLYCDPEMVGIDEAVSGRKSQRVGFERARTLLADTPATVLVTYSTSRIYRRGYMANRFLQEEIVDEKYRAITVAEDLDTEKDDWDFKTGFYAIRDDQAIKSLAKDVRNGQVGLHLGGYVTGAVPVGYVGVEDLNAPKTRRNLPRRRLAVDEEQAPIIRRAYERVADGMSIAKAYRKYREEGGKSDPRAQGGKMSREAFRRMLERMSYLGVVAYGRKRNRFLSKTDSIVQDVQPESEVQFYRDKDLRIVSDELFYAVQERLASLKSGPRGPRKKKQPKLWDVVTDVFYCAACEDQRLHVCGGNSDAMHCPNPDCQGHGIVKREDAVAAIVDKLGRMIQDDEALQDMVDEACAERGEEDQEATRQAIADIGKKISRVSAKISDLQELAGEGSEQDRAETKAKIRSVRAERDTLERERAILSKQSAADSQPLTPEGVRTMLADLRNLLLDGTAGKLGEERIDEAAEAFRVLVGGRVEVHVLTRPGRKQTVVRGVFMPNLLGPVPNVDEPQPVPAISLWLRKPPKMDRVASLVKHLYTRFDMGYPRAARVLRQAGLVMDKSNVYISYLRYFEMSGVPKPPSRPPGRQPRKA
jgi:DNA invertase Pin-like site-specific DNA recombinase